MFMKHSNKSSRKHSSSKKQTSPGSSTSQQQKEARPPVSFLFIVNELPTNDDPEIPGSIEARIINGRWHPPELRAGFFAQRAGHVYRWSNGTISEAPGYQWDPQPVGNPMYANGRIYAYDSSGSAVWPDYYKAATVFYCNHFDKFFTTQGDATTRDIATCDPEYGWQPLSFFHENNISYVDHAGDNQYLAIRAASWIEQLLPNTYRLHHTNGPTYGGLSGLLPIIIALVAFSCSRRDFNAVLINDRAWRGHHWMPHPRPTGRIEKRGMVVTVFRDPENPQGSTEENLDIVEVGPTPIFR